MLIGVSKRAVLKMEADGAIAAVLPKSEPRRFPRDASVRAIRDNRPSAMNGTVDGVPVTHGGARIGAGRKPGGQEAGTGGTAADPETEEAPEDQTVAAYKRRQEKAKAEKIERENAEAEGSTIKVEYLERVWSAHTMQHARLMDAYPRRVAMRVLSECELPPDLQAKIERILAGGMEDMREHLATDPLGKRD